MAIRALANLAEDDVNFFVENIRVHVAIRVVGWNIPKFSLLQSFQTKPWVYRSSYFISTRGYIGRKGEVNTCM